MALISKIKEVKPNYIIHHFRRHYFQIPAHRFVNHTASQRLSDYLITNTPIFGANFQPREGLFNSRVRFFAAPVQIKKKEEVINPSRHRLNEEIKVEFIRLVDDDGIGHSVLSRHEALSRAKHRKLDLVEVDRNAKPPVCKLMDYHREKYKKQIKEKERAKIKSATSLKKGNCKEVRVSAKTELKDLKMKADSVRRLMERGYRVKCSATGTEDQDLVGLLTQLSALIEDVVFVESGPKMGRDQAYLIVRHIKFGPSKKGGKKAPKDSTAAKPEIHNAATASSDSSANLEEESDYEESDRDGDDEVEPQQSPLQGQQNSPWSVTSVSSADQNFGKLFDIRHDNEKQRFDEEAAASTANSSASRFTPPETPNFTDPNVRPVSQESENRYARNVRNPMRFPTNENPPLPQPQPYPRVPPPRVLGQSGGENSPPRNFRLPSDEIQNQSNQPNSNLPDSIGHHQPPINGGNVRTQSPGFGTFSSTQLDDNSPKSPCPSDTTSTRIPGPGKVPGSISPTPKPDSPQNSGVADKKFGIFSK